MPFPHVKRAVLEIMSRKGSVVLVLSVSKEMCSHHTLLGVLFPVETFDWVIS